MSNLVYDKEENVWVYTGRTFTVSEQIIKFKDDYANFKTFEEWQKLRNLFLAYKNTVWKEEFESSVEVENAVRIAFAHVCRGGNKERTLQVLDELAEVISNQQ
jgi:hypothetical protein